MKAPFTLRFYSTALVALLSASVYGQVHRNCLTNEIRQQHIQDNPEVLKNIEEINRFTEEWSQNYHGKTSVVVTIPVVVHVVYNTSAQNITDGQINSQIAVLNADFRKMNSDFGNTPTPFVPLAADVEIDFCLASVDPQGNSTNGITRTQTSIADIGGTNNWYSSAAGGHDPWDNTKYLNIWVCSIDGGNTLGFATPPGVATGGDDGVVVDPIYFGTIGTVQAPFNLGRTTTHEVGHYFNLEHVWGLNGGCNDDDLVGDTPNQNGPSSGCPTFPSTDACTSSGDGIMFNNYMDYSDDACMTMFTQGQKTRMQAALNGPRASLLTSNGCGNSVGSTELQSDQQIRVYPNPAISSVHIETGTSEDVHFYLTDMSGTVRKQMIVSGVAQVDLTDLKPGVYTLHSDEIEDYHELIIIK